MARDPGLEDLLADDLAAVPNLIAKPMFGGLVWLHEGRLLCGARQDGLLIRLGPERAAWALDQPGIAPMMSGSRPMRGWVWVDEDGFGDDLLRRRLLDEALQFVRSLPAKVCPMPATPWDFPDAPGPSAPRRSRSRSTKA